MLSRQLINLFDMVIRLGGHEVAYAYGYLANAQGLSTNEPLSRSLDPDQKITLIDALNYVEAACKADRLDLPVTLAHIPRVRSATQRARTYQDVQHSIEELRSRMHDELKSRLFLFVPTIEAGYYNQKEAFGSDVARKFRTATSDIEDAGDCIAVGMDTAAVFHLMRVMERGVQRFGKKLGVSLADEKNWQNILDEINKQIKSLPSATAKDKTKNAKYSAVSANLFNVKLAWRNPVMHPRASYKPGQAVDIYNNVKTFMSHLATIV